MHIKLHNRLQNIKGMFWFFFFFFFPLRGQCWVLKTVKWPTLDRTDFFRNVVLGHIVRIHRILLLFRVLNVYRDAVKALRIESSIIYLHTIKQENTISLYKEVECCYYKRICFDKNFAWLMHFCFSNTSFDLTNTNNTLKTVYFVVQSKIPCILCIYAWCYWTCFSHIHLELPE